MTDLNGLEGAGSDAIWAISDFQSVTGVGRTSLVLIQKLSLDVNSSTNPALLPEVTISTFDIADYGFDQIIGLERLKFFHLNDSKRSLGSRVDRHEHIGKGRIGLEGFRLLLNDQRFRQHPMVLETPKGRDLQEDKKNLRVLRSLIKK